MQGRQSKEIGQSISTKVDIYKYPRRKSDYVPTEDEILSLGDMHGNAAKLLFALIYYHVVDLSEEDFKSFITIYKKEMHQLTQDDISNFNEIISHITISEHPCYVRLLGDLLADRGSNDYFTLKLLAHIDKKIPRLDLTIEESILEEGIPISNHDLEHIGYYQEHAAEKPRMPPDQVYSVHALKSLLEKKLINEEEVKELYQNYSKHLKLLSYYIEPNTDPTQNIIQIISHAPMGFDNVKNIADQLNVDYQDDTLENLCGTIDAINKKFQEEYVSKGQVYQLIKENTAAYNAVWNRGYQHRARKIDDWDENFNQIESIVTLSGYPGQTMSFEKKKTGGSTAYQIYYMHGHDNCNLKTRRIRNMDLNNDLGKDTHDERFKYDRISNEGMLNVLITKTNRFNKELKLKQEAKLKEKQLKEEQETNKIIDELSTLEKDFKEKTAKKTTTTRYFFNLFYNVILSSEEKKDLLKHKQQYYDKIYEAIYEKNISGTAIKEILKKANNSGIFDYNLGFMFGETNIRNQFDRLKLHAFREGKIEWPDEKDYRTRRTL